VKREAKVARLSRIDGAFAALDDAAAVVVPAHFPSDLCGRWTAGVLDARAFWNADFGGEQFSLGRAFYTHFEEERSAEYFADPEGSDALVERHAPGLQDAMRELVARATGVRVVPRRGWCGPGVHVFPPGGPVAARGGVVHFDTEGLPALHAGRRRPAITVVAMLAPPAGGGGLVVWDVRYDGRDHPTAKERRAPRATIRSQIGDVVLIDSYRLHQIEGFEGGTPRVSATVHAAAPDAERWETWF
jgi:hypothetical protein